MSYSFNYDLSRLPKEFFKEVAKVVNNRKIHKKISSISKELVRTFKVDKHLGVNIEDAISIIEDYTELSIKNLINESKFKESQKKILLVPHCCRKHMDSNCKAKFDPAYSSYFCQHCSKDCLASKATKLAEKKGCKIFIIPGGSCLKKITEKVNFDAAIGVACPEEVGLGIKYLEEKKKIVRGVPLTKNGCANTKFNINTLKEAMN